MSEETVISYCPRCEPERDPFKEILDVRYCHQHEPSRAGTDDRGITPGLWLAGGAEAGEDGAAWAKVLHRNSPYRRRKK